MWSSIGYVQIFTRSCIILQLNSYHEVYVAFNVICLLRISAITKWWIAAEWKHLVTLCSGQNWEEVEVNIDAEFDDRSSNRHYWIIEMVHSTDDESSKLFAPFRRTLENKATIVNARVTNSSTRSSCRVVYTTLTTYTIQYVGAYILDE